jgi:hypothetical protein
VDGLEKCPEYGLGLWLDLVESTKDQFMEHITMFTAQSIGLIWVVSVFSAPARIGWSRSCVLVLRWSCKLQSTQ